MLCIPTQRKDNTGLMLPNKWFTTKLWAQTSHALVLCNRKTLRQSGKTNLACPLSLLPLKFPNWLWQLKIWNQDKFSKYVLNRSNILVTIYYNFIEPFLLQEAPELCENASEFILNPWVLIQLPWYPLMFHQWLAAVMAETLKFEKEIAEFFHWPVILPMLPIICNLVKISEILRGTLVRGFLFLHTQYSLHDDIELDQTVVKGISDRVVLFAIPHLQFLLSNDTMRLVQTLKRIFWIQMKNNGPLCSIPLSTFYSNLLDKTNYLYNPEFWKSDCRGKDLFGKLLNVPNLLENSKIPVQDSFGNLVIL